jgi:hypothetical protein
MPVPTAPRNTKFDFFSDSRRSATRILVPMMPVFFVFSWLRAEMALCADAPSPPSQRAIIQEVVRVANKYIDHGICEPSRAEPSTVATMSPYTPDVEAGRAAAKYAVVWAGDIGCRNGSGTNTMNYLLVEKRGVTSAHIVGVGELNGASIERIVAATPDTLTVDAYTWGPDDAHCCASVYERWTFRLEFSVATGSYSLKHVDSKPAKPVPLRPGEKRLPTARWIPKGSED